MGWNFCELESDASRTRQTGTGSDKHLMDRYPLRINRETSAVGERREVDGTQGNLIGCQVSRLVQRPWILRHHQITAVTQTEFRAILLNTPQRVQRLQARGEPS